MDSDANNDVEFEESTDPRLLDPRLIAAQERQMITNQVLSVAEGEMTRRRGTLTPEEVDESVIVMGDLRHDYRVAERNLIALKRELGL